MPSRMVSTPLKNCSRSDGVPADPADDTGKNVFELEGSGTSATVAFGGHLG
jgi:hypothetical protein